MVSGERRGSGDAGGVLLALAQWAGQTLAAVAVALAVVSDALQPPVASSTVHLGCSYAI
jgi:hypothetical protein